MGADKTATWTLDLKSNAGALAPELAAKLEGLKGKVEQSQDALKGMSAALRSLKGSSDEVASAKEQLRARIDAEKGAVSALNLALLKEGVTYEQLAISARKAEAAQKKLDAKKAADEAKKQAASLKETADASKKFGDGLKYAGGPLSELHGKLDGFKSLLGGGGASLALFAVGVGVVAAGVTMLAGKIVEAGISLGKFILQSADSLRSMNLMRQAATGSAENAKNLGTQVDFMSRKVSTSKEKLNELAVSLAKSLSGGMSKASGQAIVDTFAAVSEAADAAGDDVGASVREIVERGKAFGRVQIDPHKMFGSLQFGDVAKALAANLGISIEAAKDQLFRGRTKLADGAKALRDAVEKNFGGINKEKLLSSDTQFEKLKEHAVELSKKVALEPLLKGMAVLVEKFDPASKSGQKLQDAFTKIGDAIANFAVDHIDDLADGIELAVDFAKQAVDVFTEWEPKVKKAVGALLDNKIIMESLKVVGVGLAVTVGVIGAAFALVGTTVAATAALMGLPFYALYKGYEFVKEIKWKDLGTSIIDGLIGGLVAAKDKLVGAVKNVASWIKSAFTGKDGIDSHSPSKLFEKYGVDTGAGYGQGLGKSKAGVQAAAEDMAPAAPTSSGSAGAGAARSAGVSSMTVGAIHVHVHLPGGASAKDGDSVARAMSAPGIMRELTRAVREALVTQGLPTQAGPAPA